MGTIFKRKNKLADITKAVNQKKREGTKKISPLRKHDWDLIKTLYMAGMEPSDILKLPEGKDISEGFLRTKIYGEGWSKERKELNRRTKSLVSANLQDRMEMAIESHYKFLIEEIEKERELIKARVKTGTVKEQTERLALLEKYEGIARRTLGLDEMAPQDRKKASFNAMIVLHTSIQPNTTQETISVETMDNRTIDITPLPQPDEITPEQILAQHRALAQ